MQTPYILLGVGGFFLILGIVRAARAGISHPQARTWLIIGVIFSLVSAWLFSQR